MVAWSRLFYSFHWEGRGHHTGIQHKEEVDADCSGQGPLESTTRALKTTIGISEQLIAQNSVKMFQTSNALCISIKTSAQQVLSDAVFP